MGGMFEWHNEDCDMEFRYESTPGKTGRKQASRSFWCNTHNQWAYLHPDRYLVEYDPHFTDKFLPKVDS